MKQLPLSSRVLLSWMVLVTAVPVIVALGDALGVLAAGLLPLALVGAVAACLLGLVIYEPPRAASLRTWLLQLRRRLVPTPLTHPSKEK